MLREHNLSELLTVSMNNLMETLDSLRIFTGDNKWKKYIYEYHFVKNYLFFLHYAFSYFTKYKYPFFMSSSTI